MWAVLRAAHKSRGLLLFFPGPQANRYDSSSTSRRYAL